MSTAACDSSASRIFDPASVFARVDRMLFRDSRVNGDVMGIRTEIGLVVAEVVMDLSMAKSFASTPGLGTVVTARVEDGCVRAAGPSAHPALKRPARPLPPESSRPPSHTSRSCEVTTSASLSLRVATCQPRHPLPRPHQRTRRPHLSRRPSSSLSRLTSLPPLVAVIQSLERPATTTLNWKTIGLAKLGSTGLTLRLSA